MNTHATRHDVVFFGEDWGRHPSTAQFLARELLTTCRLHWINSIGLREPSISAADLARVTGKLARARTTAESQSVSPEELADGTPSYILSPWIVPFHRPAAIRALNTRLLRRQLRAWPHLKPGSYTVITANPASYYLIDALQPGQVAYYCADKYAHIAGMNEALVNRFEQQMLRRADIVLATSVTLVDDLKAQHAAVHYLPHGVNHALFHQALTAPEVPVAAQPYLHHPTVGFVGLLGEHIDMPLLIAAVDALPAVHFLCVGPVEENLAPLPERSNLHYFGAVPQQQLPGYLAAMDLCILPYAMTARNHYANPTKVREYLAAGRSVVATRQPGLADIPGPVHIGSSVAEFITLLSDQVTAAAAISLAEREAISALVCKDTWHSRALELCALLSITTY